MSYEEKSSELAVRATQIMTSGMEMVDLFVNKNYLIDLPQCEPVPIELSERSFSYLSLFEITKIVYDESEDINDKLVSVYSALSNFGSTAILMICSDASGVHFYIGTRDPRQPTVAKAILEKSLRGNFPGIDIRAQSAGQIERIMQGHIPEEYSGMSVSAVSIVPGLRDENKEHFVQGLEKFIDSMSGESYTAVFVVTPLSKQQLEAKKRGYEELYTALSQCAQVNLTYAETDTEAVARGVSDTFSSAVNAGISETTGTGYSTSRSRSRSHDHSSSFGLFGFSHSFGGGRSTSDSTAQTTSTGQTASRSQTDSRGRTTSDTTTTTMGSTSTIALSRQNKTVQALMEKISEQLERIRSCESYGIWDGACYFIAGSPETALVAANTFKAIVAGETTSVENSFVNLWDDEYEHADRSLMVMEYLRYGIHPRFRYIPPSADTSYTEQIVTPASLISGREVPVLLGLPHKSVSGVTSISCAEFGRNVFSKTHSVSYRNVDIGAIYHMGEVFPQNRVRLDLESFSAHCFVTGSTGSGKSNTVYKIIDEITSSKNNIKFMVIEPAKGEYKLAFGNMPGIRIYTTSPKYYNMLSLNPFAFHDEIHVLEHLDRLIEIFSACWPLYAAMPALLKASFEQAYIRHGWDLNHSIYIDVGNGRYPTFRDVMEILPELLNKSEFSAQTKGDYIGSLVTRVESLTNGLLGQIFTGNAIDDAELFDENSIVDLSRIGSVETKALLMGVIVLRLNEYRMSTAKGTNCPLKHITIMEEAHNLLKRTSTEQGQESANVQGKSVEMISNSIAEMRTYGEGFIIVDQSPTAVDISAIKNTNTKIVMRLPEFTDCEAIGHSIGLNDAQILELSRLDKGVAAIYQNNWLEAVLTKIDKADDRYELSSPAANSRRYDMELIGDLLTELVAQNDSGTFNMSWFSTIINTSQARASLKQKCRDLLLSYQAIRASAVNKEPYNELVFRIMNCGDMFRIFEPMLPPAIKKKNEINKAYRAKCDEWVNKIYTAMDQYAVFLDQHTKDSVFIAILLHMIASTKDNLRYKLVLYCLPI